MYLAQAFERDMGGHKIVNFAQSHSWTASYLKWPSSRKIGCPNCPLSVSVLAGLVKLIAFLLGSIKYLSLINLTKNGSSWLRSLRVISMWSALILFLIVHTLSLFSLFITYLIRGVKVEFEFEIIYCCMAFKFFL